MKPPSFQFYVKDWLTGTRRLSFEAKGAYIDLLAWSWDNGPIPYRVSQIAAILGASRVQVGRIWQQLRRHHFKKCAAGYINTRLEIERLKSNTFRELQAARGRQSAAAKLNRGSTSVATPVEPSLNLALALASADLDQDLSTPAPAPVLAPFKVYKAIAGCAIDEPPATGELGEITARMKTICARADIPCDGELARKAIDAVIVGRSKRRA